ncbi:MAG: nitrilase-related carbon-nitrogen hydrolase, partial [Bdellovibrionota bacterium]
MLIKVAGAVLNQIPFDWTGNRARIEAAIAKAREGGVRLLCLPELCITGYGCEDAFFNPHVQMTALEILESLLPATKGIAVTLGLPVSHKGVLFNCIAIVCDGKIVGLAPKKFLAGDGVHYEPRWFKPWPAEEVGKIELFGHDIPFGDLHFDFNGVKVGLEICEEAWVAQRPGAVLAKRGVDIILNPSASHFAFDKSNVRKGFVGEGSRAFNVAYVYTNLLGNESGRIIFDGGVLIADGGQIIAQG